MKYSRVTIIGANFPSLCSRQQIFAAKSGILSEMISDQQDIHDDKLEREREFTLATVEWDGMG